MMLPFLFALITLITPSALVMGCHPEVQGTKTQGDMATGRQGNTDSSIIKFSPEVLVVTRDSTGFVQAMIEFFSLAGDSVELLAIEGSCKCGSASVQRAISHDSVPGKFFVQINAKHFVDPVNYVDYTLTVGPMLRKEYFRVVVYLKP